MNRGRTRRRAVVLGCVFVAGFAAGSIQGWLHRPPGEGERDPPAEIGPTAPSVPVFKEDVEAYRPEPQTPATAPLPGEVEVNLADPESWLDLLDGRGLSFKGEVWSALRREVAQTSLDDLAPAIAHFHTLDVGDFQVRSRSYPGFHLIRAIGSRWGQLDPAGAIAAFSGIEDPDVRRRALSEAVSGWAKVDLDSAVDWIKETSSAPGLEGFARAMGPFLADLPETDRERVLAEIGDESLASRVRADARKTELRDRFFRHPQETLAAFEDSPHGDFRDAGLREAFSMIAKVDPAAALGLFQRRPEIFGGSVKYAVMGTLDKWGAREPAATADWILEHGGGDREVLSASVGLIGEWTREDLNGPAAWLDGVSGDPAADPFRREYCRAVAQTDPAGAMSWAATIHDPAVRERVQAEVEAIWVKVDPAAAAAWRGDGER